jgi:hypothetical protein
MLPCPVARAARHIRSRPRQPTRSTQTARRRADLARPRFCLILRQCLWPVALVLDQLFQKGTARVPIIGFDRLPYRVAESGTGRVSRQSVQVVPGPIQALLFKRLQFTSAAGRDTAKRFRVRYDWTRLVCDPVYNTQMGAAELAALLREYRGSHVMAFAAYNAGRGRVDKWVAQYGDPRDPTVDVVDVVEWVERIPFAETRNYVQRVMENLQIYRVRIGDNAGVIIEAN